jgi:hypothetical protein
VIFLISAFWVARITGVSHQCWPAFVFLNICIWTTTKEDTWNEIQVFKSSEIFCL